MPSREGADLDI